MRTTSTSSRSRAGNRPVRLNPRADPPFESRSHLMILTVLESHVTPDAEPALRSAYQDAAREVVPPGLVRSMLIRSVNAPGLWRIETLWRSREALEEMRRQGGTPRGIQIFRAAGVEPAVSIFEVAESLSGN